MPPSRPPSRPPSPLQGGGWSSPGLTIGSSSPHTLASWSGEKSKSDDARAYPSFSTRNSGFFSRQKRRLSASLPRFRFMPSRDYQEKEKLGRGRWQLRARLVSVLGPLLRRTRVRLLLVAIVVLVYYLKFWTGVVENYRRTSLGGGKNVVIIVASNIEGGVMEWKGAREWAIERVTLWNKRKYAKRWGHELEIVNLVARKKYAHEWREGWEKADMIREAMRKYPDAEWFWWLDHNTFIMEYSNSLRDHIFKNLASVTYRDINVYNPLNISHPPNHFFLDPRSRSPDGDGDPSSINFILSQDCSGFNLGSFFMRRSEWSDRLLDIWWDPVLYEQKHMEWEHKEQDSLEHLYTHQPWIRSGVAFLPQRHINSFPPGACGDGNDPQIHYKQNDRDFLVNMAGCEFGRDCWAELYQYRELSNWINRTHWERFKDALSGLWKSISGSKEKEKHS
ncbi:galactosyl transferase GMA12/MNN10 family domain containing protein [Elaphomyces granulatus]